MIPAAMALLLVLVMLAGCSPKDAIINLFGKKLDTNAVPFTTVKFENYITLGDYKGVAAEFVPLEASDAEVEEQANAYLSQYVSLQTVKNDKSKKTIALGDGVTFSCTGSAEGVSEETLQMLQFQSQVLEVGKGELFPPILINDTKKTTVSKGDTVIFDFEGSAEGVSEETLAGMKGQGAQLEIGSGNFIPGFEDQIVGQPRAKEFTVNVTFPNPYTDESLSGKPAVFKCTVHEIGDTFEKPDTKFVGQERGTPFDIAFAFPASYGVEELTGKTVTFRCTVEKIGKLSEEITDEAVTNATQGQVTNAEDFLLSMRNYMLSQNNAQNALAAFEAAYANAKIESVPKKEANFYVDALEAAAKAADKTPVEYLQEKGIDAADMKEFKEKINDPQIKKDLFVFAVAQKENLLLTDAEFKEQLDQARQGDTSITDDDIYAEYTQYGGGKNEIYRVILAGKVQNFILTQAKDAPQLPVAQ
jgi:FKBP-type peptidyl-prolyl cis-trans isomerase (trigger factor)